MNFSVVHRRPAPRTTPNTLIYYDEICLLIYQRKKTDKCTSESQRG